MKRVQLPDYLDTTAILERSGNRLIPSSAGWWGERLSVGMTRSGRFACRAVTRHGRDRDAAACVPGKASAGRSGRL
ncbi:hypothetical protein [Paraburkholderia kirstenboschensis]|uniref:hypothetical protein n=1 Tax=Paraburkholderia kirstenboschensis TaxID=1245436 RepID=UPI0037431BE0